MPAKYPCETRMLVIELARLDPGLRRNQAGSIAVQGSIPPRAFCGVKPLVSVCRRSVSASTASRGMPTPGEQLRSNVRWARTAKGLSHEALGQEAGLHRTEVSRVERATRDVRLTTIVRLARALEVEPAALLRVSPRASRCDRAAGAGGP